MVLFFIAFPIGIFLLSISIILFFSAIYQKKRINRFLKMQEELIQVLPLDEKISCFFIDINSQGEISNKGIKVEKENVMILTDKRIIFLYIPRVGYNDLTNGNILKNLGRGLSYDGLRKKVKVELNSVGLNNLIEDSRIKYSLNYNEISEIKIKNFTSKVIFTYRGKKFRYFIRKDALEKFKTIFKNYIK